MGEQAMMSGLAGGGCVMIGDVGGMPGGGMMIGDMGGMPGGGIMIGDGAMLGMPGAMMGPAQLAVGPGPSPFSGSMASGVMIQQPVASSGTGGYAYAAAPGMPVQSAAGAGR